MIKHRIAIALSWALCLTVAAPLCAWAAVTQGGFARVEHIEVPLLPFLSLNEQGFAGMDVGDLNGDGIADLVTIGDRSLAFLAGPDYPVQVLYQEVLLSRTIPIDWDGDGDVDLIRWSPYALGVLWLENVGDNSIRFVNRVLMSSDVLFQDLRATDFDGDGNADLLIDLNTRLELFQGTGGGAIAQEGKVLMEPFHYSPIFEAFDADLDGDADLLIGEYGQTPILHLNSGTAPSVFEPIRLNTSIQSIDCAVHDMDSDGDPDILIAGREYDPNLGYTEWFENRLNTSGVMVLHHLETAYDTYRTLEDAAFGDLDGDGDTDFAAIDRVTRLRWFESDGGAPPTFTIREVPIPQDYDWHLAQLVMADMGQDGDQDLVAAVYDGPLLLIENVSGDFSSPETTALIPHAADRNLGGGIDTLDPDGDGDQDLLITTRFYDQDGISAWTDVSILEQTGGEVGTLKSRRLTYDLRRISGIALEDIDGDGDQDIVISSVGECGVHWFENTGDPDGNLTVHPIHGAPPEVRGMRTGDFDSDGDPDIVAFGLRSQLLINSGGASSEFAAIDLAPPGVEFDWGAFGDIDGDGDSDIVAMESHDLYSNPAPMRWLENNGLPVPSFWLRPFPEESALRERGICTVTTPYEFEIADIDSDGDGDIVAGFRLPFSWGGCGGTIWYERDISAPDGFIQHFVEAGAKGIGVEVADADLDGRLDIMTASRDDGRVSWCRNLGGDPNVFQEIVLTNVTFNSEGGRDMVYSDLDGDGLGDIVILRPPDGIDLYRNITPVPPVMVSEQPFVLDFSGDGLLQAGEPGQLLMTIQCLASREISDIWVQPQAASASISFDPPIAQVERIQPGEYADLVFDMDTDPIDIGGDFLIETALEWAGRDFSVSPITGFFGGNTVRRFTERRMVWAPIPDGDPNGLSIDFHVAPGGGIIRALSVGPIVWHERRGDMLITITGPDGLPDTLFEGQPGDEGLDISNIMDASDAFSSRPPDGTYTITFVDRLEGVGGTLVRCDLNIDYDVLIDEPWSSVHCLDVLLGGEAPTPGYDYNHDSQVDAADLVTAIESLE